MDDNTTDLLGRKNCFFPDHPILEEIRQKKLKHRDTVIKKYKTGLLGYHFAPQIAGFSPYNGEENDAGSQ